jgi:hypothetical protein
MVVCVKILLFLDYSIFSTKLTGIVGLIPFYPCFYLVPLLTYYIKPSLIRILVIWALGILSKTFHFS